MSRPRMYCPHCGRTRVPAARYQGSPTVAVAMFACLVLPWVAYELWRRGAAEQWVCPACGRAGMRPLSSAFARPADDAGDDWQVVDDAPDVVAAEPPPSPAAPVGRRFRVEGVDRQTGLTVTEYIAADTAQEARTMAEVVGIGVTAVAAD